MNYHYYNMTCLVTIGNVVFNNVNAIRIVSTIKQLSDKAKIIVPREFNSVIVNGGVDSIA